MKKLFDCKKFIMMFICICVLGMLSPMKSDAAKLDKTSVMMLKGGTTSILLSKYPKKTKKFVWKVSGKAAKITRRKKNLVKIKAVNYGTSAVKIKVGKKTLKCTVRVINPANLKAPMRKGSSTIIEIGKNGKATTSDPKVVKVSKSGTSARLTAISGGTAKITIRTGGKTVTFVVVVPGKPVTPETSETPETEKKENGGTYETETPNTEKKPVTIPITPGTEPETEEEYEIDHIVRREFLVGVTYYCNAKDYSIFNPQYQKRLWTAEESNAWIDSLGSEERELAEQNILDSDYPQEFKTKLINILNGKTKLTDNLKAEIRNEFFNYLSDHAFSCGGSTSSEPVYFYGPWEQIPDSEYDEWKKQNGME